MEWKLEYRKRFSNIIEVKIFSNKKELEKFILNELNENYEWFEPEPNYSAKEQKHGTIKNG